MSESDKKGTRRCQMLQNDTARQRAVNNVLNNKKFKLSHVLAETVVMDECSLQVTSKLRLIER